MKKNLISVLSAGLAAFVLFAGCNNDVVSTTPVIKTETKYTYLANDSLLDYFYSVYEYDESGKLTAQTDYNASDETTSTYAYSYNDAGLLSSVEIYDQTFDSSSTKTYEYNSDNQLTQLITDYGDEVFTYKYEYEDGKLTKETRYDDDELYCYYIYEYNDNGYLSISTKYDASGDVSYSDTYEYNSKGILTMSFDYDSDNICKNYTTYEYDDYGNLTKEKLILPAGTLYSLTVHEYTYWN